MSEAILIDEAGNEWQINATPFERDEILDKTEVDIYDLIDEAKSESFLRRLEKEDDFVRDLMWCICREQCEERNIDERGFKRHIYGETLDRSVEMFMKACSLFFRSPVERAMVQKLLDAMQAAAEKHSEAAKLTATKFDAVIADEMQKIDVESLVETSMNSAGQHSRQPDSKNGNNQAEEPGDLVQKS